MAYTFNGSNQNLRIESAIVSAYPFTIAATCKISSAPSTFYGIVTLSPGASANSPYVYLGHRNNGVITAGIATDAVAAAANSAQNIFTIGSQFWLAATYTATNVSIFFNGSSVGSASNTISFPAGMSRVAIASLDRQSPAAYVDGSVAEVAIWNAELTAAEISALAAGFTPDQVCTQSLQFYAPLIRDLVDLRQGRTIANINAASVSTHPRIIQ